jgi:hypothetical protein
MRSPLQSRVSFDEYPAQIPFKRTPGDLPIVLADTPNGKLWMLVDTGCDAVVFTPRTARRTMMRITPFDGESIDAVGNAHRIEGLAPIDRVSLGPAHFFGFYSIVSEMGNITDKDHPPGGVAGLPLFGDALLTIDYAHDRLIVQPGTLPPPDGINVLPMVVSNGKMSVPFDYGDRKLWLILDTGFSGYITIPRDEVPYFPGAEKKLAHGSVKCLYGTDNVDFGQLNDNLGIGQHTIERPVVEVGNGKDAMMGAQYLKHFIVTIDQRHQRIRFDTTDGRALFLPAIGRETEHEVAMLDRLMQRPATDPSEMPTTQPAATADPESLNP